MTSVRAAVARARVARPAQSPAGARSVDAKVIRLHTRREEQSTRTTAGRLLPLLSGLLFLAVLGVVVFQALLVQSQNRLDALNKRIGQEEAAAKALRLQIADAEAPSRIATAAKTRLGMVAPDEVIYLQRGPDDDQRAAYDPAKEPVTTTTTPPAPSVTAKQATNTTPAQTAKPTTTVTTTPMVKPKTTVTTTPTLKPTTTVTTRPAPRVTTTTTVRSAR
ncbi:MAG: hypothetical protein N2037_08980 [Acidimicrobiales bacterium]|nr:hypothetical protein [Acidimicrobiales bacterium]